MEYAAWGQEEWAGQLELCGRSCRCYGVRRFLCNQSCLHTVLYIELLENNRQVVLDGLVADAELAADLLVAETETDTI